MKKAILSLAIATAITATAFSQNSNPWPSTGNVGIGTTSPSNPLDVSTSGATPLTVQRTSAASNVGIEFRNQTTSWFAGQASNGNFSFYNAASLNNGNFQISPAGYLGFGTTTPTHSVTLSNNSTGIAMYRTLDQTTNYERVRQYYNGNDFTFASEKGGSGVTRDIKFTIGIYSGFTLSAAGAPLTNAAYEVSRGAIGNATSLKSIFATTGALGSTVMQNGVAIVPTIAQTGTGGYRGLFISPFESTVGSGKKYLIDAGTNNDVNGSATHTSKFTVDNTGSGYFDGKVGIGITNPSEKLHVANGGIKISNTGSVGLKLFNAADDTEKMHLYWRPTDDVIEYNTGSGTTRQMSFVTGGIEGIRINAAGKVGIGTTVPDEKLTVNGKIHAREVRVDLNVPGPDYVFEPDYKLTSLHELKGYLDRNHHLPEMPSAIQMEKEGISLSDMNMRLLKKVEELTLYLIEKDEQLSNQQKDMAETKRTQQLQIDELKKQIGNIIKP